MEKKVNIDGKFHENGDNFVEKMTEFESISTGHLRPISVTKHPWN